MGYTILVGHAEYNSKYESGCLTHSVAEIFREDAPIFVNEEGQTNYRAPSYIVWHEFCKETNIKDIFFDHNERIIGGYPGYILITGETVEYLRNALLDYRYKNRPKLPGFCSYGEEIRNDRDPTLARLIWLVYWVTWAFDNCHNPVIMLA